MWCCDWDYGLVHWTCSLGSVCCLHHLKVTAAYETERQRDVRALVIKKSKIMGVESVRSLFLLEQRCVAGRRGVMRGVVLRRAEKRGERCKILYPRAARRKRDRPFQGIKSRQII